MPDGTSADRIRLGIVGAGTHAQKMLIPSLAYVEDLRLVAMSSRTRETADRVERMHGVKCHVGHEALLADETIDAVIVALPTAIHETVGKAALEAGKHVLIESGYPKLLDADVVDVLRGLQKNRVLMFGNCELYMPIYEKLKELLESLRARIGPDEALSVSTRYYWWPRYSQGAGIHHFLNLLLWLNGPVRKVWSIGTKRQIQGMLEYANNDIGLFSGAEYDTPYLPMERVEVLGKDSAITATNGYDAEILRRDPARRPRRALSVRSGARDGLAPFVQPHLHREHVPLSARIRARTGGLRSMHPNGKSATHESRSDRRVPASDALRAGVDAKARRGGPAGGLMASLRDALMDTGSGS